MAEDSRYNITGGNKAIDVQKMENNSYKLSFLPSYMLFR